MFSVGSFRFCGIYLHFIVRCSLFVFFFKQKTAYDMRISDLISDVCSSDLSPCAVFPSAARALYSTFIGNPIKRLPDGMTRMSFVSSGESCDIFQARLNTSAAWSRDRAPDTIWAFRRASGPTI